MPVSPEQNKVNQLTLKHSLESKLKRQLESVRETEQQLEALTTYIATLDKPAK